MAVSNVPVLKYTPQSHSAQVENISEHAGRQEAVTLYNNYVHPTGDMRRSGEAKSSSGTPLEHDAFKKPLNMSGYMLAGKPLATSLLSSIPNVQHISKQPNYADTRRNLYVLGLPFSLTKVEFAEVFSRYGTVSHCVILATVDNSSRRRGFIVMSTHEEAKSAMIHLSRSQIKGHTLDISWAVVQRSQGFLDGADRSSVLDTQSSESAPSSNIQDRLHPRSANFSSKPMVFVDSADNGTCLMLSLKPTPTLLVSNLPTVLFSHPQDLHPLFYPFGETKKLEIHHSPSMHLTDNISVLVEYSTSSSAQEAKETLQGQSYANHKLTAEYVQLTSSGAGFRSTSSIASTGFNGSLNSPNLNPFATPFVLETSSSLAALRTPSFYNINSENHDPYATYPGCFSAKTQRSSCRALSPFHTYNAVRSAPACLTSKSDVAISCNSDKRPSWCGQRALSNLSNVAINTPFSHSNWYA